MIHVEEHTLGSRHLRSWEGWVNFLEHCFSLPLSSQAVHILVNVCLVPCTAFPNLLLYCQWDWQCTALPKLSMGKRGKCSEKSKGGLSEVGLLWIWLHYHWWPKHGAWICTTWFKDYIVSVMGTGRTKHQCREHNWSSLGIIKWLVLHSFIFLKAL